MNETLNDLTAALDAAAHNLAVAQAANVTAENAYAKDPTDRNWTSAEKAANQLRRAQIDLARAKTHEREERERVQAMDRAEKLSEFNRFAEQASEARFQAKFAELVCAAVDLDRKMSEIFMQIEDLVSDQHALAGEGNRVARDLAAAGQPTAEIAYIQDDFVQTATRAAVEHRRFQEKRDQLNDLFLLPPVNRFDGAFPAHGRPRWQDGKARELWDAGLEFVRNEIDAASDAANNNDRGTE